MLEKCIFQQNWSSGKISQSVCHSHNFLGYYNCEKGKNTPAYIDALYVKK
jgi:hypothetical protein